VPQWANHTLRIVPPGPAWGIAGYSEGGYCAVNIGLQDARWFGSVGSMSGYFAPNYSILPSKGNGGKGVYVTNVFAGQPSLLARNTPYTYIQHFPLGERMPSIWLAAGGGDQIDVDNARVFRHLALHHLVSVPLVVIKGGGHQAMVWRNALAPMLKWMTPQLTKAAAGITSHDLIATHTRLTGVPYVAH
jgi:S-formylglutathione hydrolase FrmB